MLFALTMPLLLTACGGGRFDTRESTNMVLPPVIQYEREFLQTAANEVEGKQCESLNELTKDYKTTRDKLRIAKRVK